MEKVRRDTNFIVLGLVLYTLLRYVIFALEPLARVCFVRLVCSDSAERTVLLQQLEENAANSGVLRTCIGVSSAQVLKEKDRRPQTKSYI